MILSNSDLMNDLCKAFGMPKHVKSFKIEAAVDSIVTVTVTYYPEELLDVTTIAAKAGEFQLVKLEPVTETFELRKK